MNILSVLNKKSMAPVFYKEDNETENLVNDLTDLLDKVNNKGRLIIENKLKLINCGIVGEKKIKYELKNSNIPMYVLHGLFFEKNDLSSQIDYLVITDQLVFIIECKNLIGNIEIDNRGTFIRTFKNRGKNVKEAIYSPITQNNRHLELIKIIREESRNNILTKYWFNKYFEELYIPIVVLANPKTILKDRYAKKDIKEKVVKIEHLITYIKEKNKKSNLAKNTTLEMEELALYFKDRNMIKNENLLEKYKEFLLEEICPLCKSKLIKRSGSYGNFMGCANYPNCKYTKKLDK